MTVNGLAGDDTVTSGIGVTGPARSSPTAAKAPTPPSTSARTPTTSCSSRPSAPASPASAPPTDTGIDVSAGTEETLVQPLNGNDRVSGQNGISTASHFTIDGGNGDDTLLGGDGDDLLLGGSGDDLVDGNRGADTALMGSGNDTFQWDPGDGNDTVEGESGTDAMQFNGSNIGEEFTASANGDPACASPATRQHRHGPRHARARSTCARSPARTT